MRKTRLGRRRFVGCFACFLAAVMFCASLLAAGLVHAASGGDEKSAWAAPAVMAIKRVSSTDSAQNQPNFLSNLDCGLVTYRLVNSATMQTGCFTPTAMGLLDSDSDTVIFNGTDEGLPLLSYSAHEVLAPWPDSLDLVALDAIDTGGSYISLYKNPLGVLQDQRNFFGQLTAKKLAAPPELPLIDASGQRLVINPQTMAFSDGGSWLVAEDLNGSFMRINLATLDMTAFAPSFGSQGSPALLKSQVAVSSDGRYVAIENDATASFKIYDLTTCSGPAAGLQPEHCQSYDYLPFVKQQITGLHSLRHVRFVNDGLLSFEAATSDPAHDGIYELAPTDSITSLTDYIGLGDSYTSGEGAFDYLAGTDTDDNICHLSANSYPLLLTHDLFSAAGGHSVACSGAVIHDVGTKSASYRGQVREGKTVSQLQQTQPALLNSVMTNFIPGYVAQQAFVKQYQPQILTVSVGGNDVGFGDILQNCVLPRLTRHLSDDTCYNTYEARLEVMQLTDRTIPRWTALYKQLLAESPGTRLYAIGYPQVVADTGNCAVNVQMGKSELEFAEELTDYLNDAIQQAAAKAGVSYVDISQALAGHRLCETASYNVAVNGLTAGTDAGAFGLNMFGRESYHPNALGHELIEQAILRQTHNLTGAPQTNTGSTQSKQKLSSAPKTGKKVGVVVPGKDITPKVAKRGKSTSVTVKGSAASLKPKTTHTVHLDGSDGLILGTATSDDNGDLTTTVMIPVDTEPGAHTIDVTGDNQADEPVDVTQPIYIPVSDNDSDGDGIVDMVDTCSAVANSGQDADQDGIDDVCDGFIAQPPAVTGDHSSGGGSTNDSSTGPPVMIGDGGEITPTGSVPPTGAAGPLQSSPAADSSSNLAAPVGAGLLQTSRVVGVLSSSNVIASAESGDTPSPRASTANVLGTSTTNPSSVKADNFHPAHSIKAIKQSGGWYYPKVIYWLRWATLLVIVWLVLFLLSLWLSRGLQRAKRLDDASR